MWDAPGQPPRAKGAAWEGTSLHNHAQVQADCQPGKWVDWGSTQLLTPVSRPGLGSGNVEFDSSSSLGLLSLSRMQSSLSKRQLWVLMCLAVTHSVPQSNRTKEF